MSVVRLPAVLNVAAFYVVGIPIGVALTFSRGWGIFGLWVGLLSGMCFMVTGLALVFGNIEWEAVSASARASALKTVSLEDVDEDSGVQMAVGSPCDTHGVVLEGDYGEGEAANDGDRELRWKSLTLSQASKEAAYEKIDLSAGV